ncbi:MULTISPECIES: chaplin [unclassified Streptomyces]|uniref:chaplin n=1 Tax=unclassified Streptomyces TaxID=2593676 RepID=UPI002DD8B727|nr:chaplin [Streptomyces sp. NBC_01445]WSE08078.1 chaplin [Streptomyces sp. NBC_01445]
MLLTNIAKKAAPTFAVESLAAGACVGAAFADADADGQAANSPGVGSGNPVQVPVNATGNSVNVIGLLNPTFGNASENS